MKPRARQIHKGVERYKNKYRDSALSMYYGETITLTGVFKAVNTVVRINYYGKSVLFKGVMLGNQRIDHMWIHFQNIVNPEILVQDKRYAITGHVINYFQNRKNKTIREKYTLENVRLERISDL